jgi:hypothetical protein
MLPTQNPAKYEGTFPLPESQHDRFPYKAVLDYRRASRIPLHKCHIGIFGVSDDKGLAPRRIGMYVH